MEQKQTVSQLKKNRGFHIYVENKPNLDLILRDVVNTYPKSAALEILSGGNPLPHLSIYKQPNRLYLISSRNDVIQLAEGLYFKVVHSVYAPPSDRIPILIRWDARHVRIAFRKYEPKSSSKQPFCS